LASILQRPGRRVGLFTSPHLVDFRERIRIDATSIGRDAIAARVARDRDVWDRHQLTFFEATTALALSHFREVGIDVAVLEVGLGGRLDATNCVEPLASVITPIGRDHVHILGNTLREIAGEKAGILRRGVPAVIAGGLREATAVLEARAHAIGAPVYFRPRCISVRAIRTGDAETRFRIEPRPVDSTRPGDGSLGAFPSLDLTIALPGAHQAANAALAALAALVPSGMTVSASEIVRGLARWRWPGRMERPVPGLPLIFDCGHNREGGRVLASALASTARRRPI
jgi:dihydrofolate synthase/folylpolyglutamate synthase